jgi:hypothetical protein
MLCPHLKCCHTPSEKEFILDVLHSILTFIRREGEREIIEE